MVTIIVAIISSGVLSTLITALFSAWSNRRSRLKAIEEKLDKIEANQQTEEKNALRTQLLMMIADYPDEVTDILRLAEHYFKDLKGNWTATTVFNHWLKSRNIAEPDWFPKN